MCEMIQNDFEMQPGSNQQQYFLLMEYTQTYQRPPEIGPLNEEAKNVHKKMTCKKISLANKIYPE